MSNEFSEDKHPNFRGVTGRLYLVRCPECLRENYALAVASGQCAFCGWREKNKKDS